METMPWYRSNVLRGLLVAILAFALQALGVTDNVESEAGKYADAGLQIIELAALAWAGYARVRQPTPPITQGVADKMTAMTKEQP